jgi:hypothetical protein
MSDLAPVVDITSLIGVESLFSKGARDPWGPRLAGALAEFIVYSESARFTMPIWAKTEWCFEDDPRSRLYSRNCGLATTSSSLP